MVDGLLSERAKNECRSQIAWGTYFTHPPKSTVLTEIPGNFAENGLLGGLII